MVDELSRYNAINEKTEKQLTKYILQHIRLLPISGVVSLDGSFTPEHLREIADALEERSKAARRLELGD